MTYQVIARKWRPQNFDGVVFQEHISKTLQNSIADGRVYHAYLFSGPRGVGKTTTARILAKTLNCLEGPSSNPCDKCDNCLEIKNGNSFDVIEIDGASNRGIDDIRELRENVNFAPLKSRYKVYIIDEVHMVTREAFNALLKTLEEPPPHVKFIFATTEIHKIPDTILSRCQKFFFKKIPIESIVVHLRHIVKSEGFSVSDTALYSIARASEGSMRDAQSLLDQVISFSERGSDVTEADALSILGIVPLDSYIKLLGFIADSDSVAIFDEVDRIVEMGGDLPRYSDGFIDAIRCARLMKNGISIHTFLGLSPVEAQSLRDISTRFHDEELSIIFRIAADLQKNMKFSGNERINIEMALLDMVTMKGMPSLSSILSRLDEAGGLGTGPLPGGGMKDDNRKEQAKTLREYSGQQRGGEKTAAAVKDVNREWQSFLSDISSSNTMLHFILKSAEIKLTGNDLFIRFKFVEDDPDYKTMLDSGRISAIRDGMSRRMGRVLNIVHGDGNADRAEAKETETKVKIPSEDPQKTLEKSGGKKPVVEKVKDLFHGQEVKKGE